MSKEQSESKDESPAFNGTTITLDYPIEWGDELVKSIKLKRPKGKHIKGIGREANIASLLKIAGKISDYTPAFYDELDAADCLKVTDAIGDFLGDGQET